ncbi:Glycosyltransferase involved in cell wall bisynthesis [Sphingobium faniae]|nr:Glycosyltransferase involved in cell wall bisynthesis [Sphingobium faniae]
MTAARPLIAIGNYDFRASGTVLKSIEIASAAHSAGMAVELWAIRADGPMLARIPAGIPVIAAGGGLKAASRAQDLALNIPALARTIRTRRPTLFLSGGNHFHLPARAALALSGRRKTSRLLLRVSNSSHEGKRNGFLNRWDQKLKYGGSQSIVAVSQELAGELTQLGMNIPIHCIPNGVDVAKLRRMSEAPFEHPFLRDRENGHPVLVSMGRLSRQKGFDIALRGFAQLCHDPLPRLFIIGTGPSRIKESLLALARDLKIADRVDFLGYQDNPAAILSRCDLFISASRWEGASNALIEALACGLPLVATDCPTGNREIVTHGPYGRLVPVEDAAALAAAVEAELRHPRARDRQRAGAENWRLENCMAAWVQRLQIENRQ